MELFKRAAHYGLANIQKYLPYGRQEGPEWVARNPKRADSNPGSFSINTHTGQWADFAEPDAKGGDVVSLVAYLDGISQADAARKILNECDPEYFPSASDNFKAPTVAGDYWAGWSWVRAGVPTPPELDTAFHQKQNGPEAARWPFIVKGRVVLWVVRYLKDGKKADRPFTLWVRGSEYKWRACGFEKGTPIPLWGVDEIAARPNDPVLMFEGQKDAAKMAGVLGEDYVVTGFYGGAGRVKETDLEPLRGREVWYCPDADGVGRKVLKVFHDLDIKIHLIRSPLKCAKGWSLADESLDRLGYLAYIDANSDTKEEDVALDDMWSALPIKICGVKDSRIYVYSEAAQMIFEDPWASLTKQHFMRWLPRQVWGRYFGKDEGGIHWEALYDSLTREAEKVGFFNPSVVRYGGAWLDAGKVVVSTGESLWVDGQRKGLGEHDSEYFYVKSDRKRYSFESPIPDCSLLVDIVKLLRFVHPSHNLILMGWILLAPYGGVLSWRPNMWVTGESGSGKSTVFSTIIEPILGGIATFGRGLTSTAAGVRSALNSASVPFVMDEMESRDVAIAERHSQILTMFRESSSGLGSLAKTLHGSAGGGEGKQWIVNSMVCFGSIGAALEDSADKSRFTVVTLENPVLQDKRVRLENFKKLEGLARLMTPEWVDGFHARTLGLMPEVFRTITQMIEAAIPITRSRRDADQIGTIMAGAWMVDHEQAPTAAEATEFLKVLGARSVEDESKPDHEAMMDAILAADLQVDGYRLKVGRALILCANNGVSTEEAYIDSSVRLDAIKMALVDIGIKYAGEEVHVAINHPDLSRILGKTPWAKTYSQMIPRLGCCLGASRGGGRFSGVQKRFFALGTDILLDNIPF